MALQQSRQARKYTIPGAEERDRPEHLVLTIDCQSYGYRNYNENLEGKDPEPQARHLVKPEKSPAFDETLGSAAMLQPGAGNRGKERPDGAIVHSISLHHSTDERGRKQLVQGQLA